MIFEKSSKILNDVKCHR